MIPVHKLTIFRAIQQDSIIQKYISLLNDEFNKEPLYYDLVHELLINNTALFDHIMKVIIESENSFTIHLENKDYKLTEFEYVCLQNDLYILKMLMSYKFDDLFDLAQDGYSILKYNLFAVEPNPLVKPYLTFFEALNDKITKEECDSFISLCQTSGIGKFAFHTAFYFTQSQEFYPIIDFSPLSWDRIYGYQSQKDQLKQNTEAFLSGAPFHNTLLVGSSGTGKSSSVKALVARLAHKKLRLIQMQKGQLHHLPRVLEQIGSRGYKFIIFIDDLSFEANEDEYKFLKSFIEGGIVKKDDNVVFYITSNRRHLIKEIRSERENDIHLNDFIQEMTSLSDRFGLTLFYEAPNQKVYLQMVEKMLQVYDVTLSTEALLIKSRQWSLEHGGMSGRTAEQFVKHLVMQIKTQ